jgi:hypothetical protein
VPLIKTKLHDEGLFAIPIKKSCVHIELGEQDLNGRIPTKIGLLTALTYLDISDNRLQGSIPETLYNCKSLQKIFLYRNRDE